MILMHAQTLLPLLLDLLMKSVGVLALTAGSALLLRRASAANRHSLWLAGLLALLLLPCTKLAKPLWAYEWQRQPKPVSIAPVVVRAELPAAPLPMEPVVMREISTPINWAEVAVSLWLAGMVILVALRLAVSWQVWKLARSSRPLVHDQTLLMWQKLAGEGIPLRTSDQCRVPMVVGVLRPVVLLPLEALQWTEARLVAALRHELGHVRRRDCLTRLLADGLRAVYWINPLIWVASRELRLAQEQACDDLVLGAGVDAMDYANQLVDIVRSLGEDRVSARHALAMAQPSTLETRVLSIVDGARDRRALSSPIMAGGAVVVLAVLTLCGVAQLAGAEKDQPTGAAGAEAEPLVYITSKFIEMPRFAPLPPTPGWRPIDPAKVRAGGEIIGIFDKDEATAVMNGFNQKKGVDITSAPSVTTKSNQEATMEIVREFMYPTQWEKEGEGPAQTSRVNITTTAGAWIPKVPLQTKNVGVTLGVIPSILASGKIALKLAPEVVEFEGFTDLDAPKGAAQIAGISIPAGHRSSPNFSVRKLSASVTIQPGQTVVIASPEAKMIDGKGNESGIQLPTHDRPRRQLLVLVTAELVKPRPEDLAPQDAPSSNEEVRVSFPPPGAPMAQILAFYAQLTGKKVIADPAFEGVKLNIQASRPLPKPKAAKFIEAILLVNGYSLVTADNGTVKLAKLGATFGVFGAVNKQGKYDIPTGGIQLEEAIQMAGGFAPSASPGQVKISRKRLADVETFNVKTGWNPIVQPNDRISVGTLNDDITEQYLEGSVLSNKADREADLGHLQEALEGYQQAKKIVDQIAETTPAWQSEMVKTHQDKIANSIKTVQTKLEGTRPAKK